MIFAQVPRSLATMNNVFHGYDVVNFIMTVTMCTIFSDPLGKIAAFTGFFFLY